MFEEYDMICLTVSECGRVEGRKRFQKIVYVSKELGLPFHETFEWNMFGPYSSELSSEINSLCEMNLLHEDLIDSEYHYWLSEEGESYLKSRIPGLEDRYGKECVELFGRVFSIFNEYDSQELEKTASVHFLSARDYAEDYVVSFLEYSKQYEKADLEIGKKLFKNILGKLEDLGWTVNGKNTMGGQEAGSQ